MSENKAADRLKKIAIVTTAYNEAGNIADFVAQMDIVASDIVCKRDDMSGYSIWVANNGSTDETLGELLRLQSEYMNLYVVNNYFNYGYDVSILKCLSLAQADLYVVMCSDLEDPPDTAKELINYYLIQSAKDPRIDCVIACKRVPQSPAMNIFRKGYYLISGFGERRSEINGFHGFGIYTHNVIERAFLYAKHTSANARSSLLWGAKSPRVVLYKKGSRRDGVSSYTTVRYIAEALNQIMDLPALSTRLAIRLSMMCALTAILLIFAIVVNYFLIFMNFASGISTVLVLFCGLFSMLFLVVALVARQIENIRSPNLLITAAAEVYPPKE
jgi:glycosyltransferase involved in cell wall biosynthesis